MQYQYIVSAHKASSVTASVSGRFRTPDETNLLVGKGNRLELFTWTTQENSSSSLQLVGEYSFNGQITSLHILHPSDRLTCLCLVFSGTAAQTNKFAVLSWDAATQSMMTESSGHLIEHTGRPTTESKLVAVDCEARAVIVYAYQGIVHIFPLVGTASHSSWRSLLKATREGYIGIEGEEGEDEEEERHPYTVREQLVSGLRVPRYLVPPEDDGPTTSSGRGRGKGKGVAHSIRSSDMYPVVTRYIRELKVLDLQFLRRSSSDSSDALSRQRQPAFAVLYEDANMARLVHAYSLDSAAAPQQQQQQGSLLQPQTLWTSEHVEATASMLVPLARGAVLVVGDEALTVVAGSRAAVILSKRAARPTAFEWVDAQACERLLLADDSGTLSLVVLQYDASGHVRALFNERLGGISAASSLSYLADGCVYVGSQCGDHAVVRLHAEPLGSEPYDYDSADDVLAHPLGISASTSTSSAGEARPITFVEVLESFANLAPVVDLCVVGMGGGGSGGGGSSCGSVVTCSGLRSTPGLRVVRNGVGVETVAEAAGIGGVVSAWSLTAEISGSAESASTRSQQVVLVLSLVDRTRVLGWTEADGDSALELAELSEEEEGGWRLDAVTLAAGLAGDGRHAVQVTPRAVLLLQIMEGGAWRQCAAWQAPAVISAASAVGDQIAVAVDGSLVVYIEVRGSALACVAQQRLAHAVACIDVHSWAPPGQPSAFVAVGLWAEADSGSESESDAGSVRLLALPGLQQMAAVSLRADSESAVPRSLLMCVLGGSAHLAVGG
ncbi:hypothetical protein GGF42_007475, partial [Coemansia sp. RSA 2424]